MIDLIKEIREKSFMKFKGRKKAKFWKEKDFIDKVVDTGVVILPSTGCKHAMCVMCGYIYDCPREIKQQEILEEFRKALENLGNIEYLKIFTSGSFLDKREIKAETIKRIVEEINKRKIRRVQIESRPEFVTEENLEIFKDLKAELEIGIGLETADDFIRNEIINKGFSFKDFLNAVNMCREHGIKVKAYLLLKPPFLTEKEAIEDVKNSIKKIEKIVDRVSVNPMNVQKGTLVEVLWKKGEYRPPWLWSVVEVLKMETKAFLMSKPTAGGLIRGAHNCFKCDREVLRAIEKFNLTQDRKVFDEVECVCRDEWRAMLEIEVFENGPLES